MPTLSRDELVDRAYPLIAIEARRFGSYPPGTSAEDLESLGGEVLVAAAAEYDGPEDGWRKWAKYYLRNRMRSFMQKARRQANRLAPMEVETPEGEFLPRPDPRVADPVALAETREKLRPHVSATRLMKHLPTPSEVADRVTQLRAAMFDAIDLEKVSSMMTALQEKAMAGDLKAVKLLVDLLAPARSGVTVQQQAVVIRTGDLD